MQISCLRPSRGQFGATLLGWLFVGGCAAAALTAMSFGIRGDGLSDTGTHDLAAPMRSSDFVLASREIPSISVPYVTPVRPGPIAFDVFPHGAPPDYSANTGVAWIDIVSSDIRADGKNYESLRLGVLADGTAHVGAAKGGAGKQEALVLQMSGGPVVIAGSLQVEQLTPANSGAPCTPGTLAWDANYAYVCVSKDRWKRSTLEDW
jgi:hypothetical protein